MTVRSRSLQLARPGVARGLDPFAGNGNRLNPGLRIAGHRGVARVGNYGLLSAVLSSHRIVSRPQRDTKKAALKFAQQRGFENRPELIQRGATAAGHAPR